MIARFGESSQFEDVLADELSVLSVVKFLCSGSRFCPKLE